MPRYSEVSPCATAYSYLRFSSPEQSKGDSIRRQIELRDAWIVKTGAALDTTLTLRDEGISGFTGAHRANPDRHALAAFLELVRQQRIPKGSFLIVESLDRLSREHIRPALTLLLNLIESGIRVVQLLPDEQVFDEHVEPMVLMMAIMELSRGHSESRMKSERLGRAWTEKKKRAAEGKILTHRTPAWIAVEGGRFVAIEPAAAVVRRIFRMAIDGHGVGAITKKLNSEGVPPLGSAEFWPASYVAKILANRAALGECQPHTGIGAKGRRPDGAPIPGYFPAVVTDAEFHAARAALASRRTAGGRIGKRVNLFTGLARDARDGSPLHRVDKGKRAVPNLVSSKAVSGHPGSEYTSFPLDVFERAVLSELREIDPRSVLPATDGEPDRLLALAGRVADLDSRLEKVKAAIVGDGEVGALLDVLRRLDAERAAAAAELARARHAAASPVSAAWGEYRTLVDAMDGADDPDEVRVRLRSALRRMVTGIWCVFATTGRVRLAAIQVRFAVGGHRDYLVRFVPAFANASVKIPSAVRVWASADVAELGTFDLRKKSHAAGLAAALPAIAESLRDVP